MLLEDDTADVVTPAAGLNLACTRVCPSLKDEEDEEVVLPIDVRLLTTTSREVEVDSDDDGTSSKRMEVDDDCTNGCCC